MSNIQVGPQPGTNYDLRVQPPSQSLPQSGAMQQVEQWNQQMSQLEERYRGLTGRNYRYASASATAQLPGVPPLQEAAMQGSSGVQGLANQLAERYGIGGRGPIVDPSGNFTRMPNSADEAAKFQYIALALANYRAEQAQRQAVSAQQTGIGLVQSRGRGSLATLQSGAYQSLAETHRADIDRIAAMQPDFSYFIEREMMDRQEALQRDMMAFAKKQQKYAMIGMGIGLLLGGFGGGMPGAMMGAQAGSQMGAGMAAY